MSILEKIKAEIIHTFTWTNKKSDLHYDMQKVLQIIDKYAGQEQTSPCDLCRFNPPSSADGKPCTMCPAEKGGE